MLLLEPNESCMLKALVKFLSVDYPQLEVLKFFLILKLVLELVYSARKAVVLAFFDKPSFVVFFCDISG